MNKKSFVASFLLMISLFFAGCGEQTKNITTIIQCGPNCTIELTTPFKLTEYQKVKITDEQKALISKYTNGMITKTGVAKNDIILTLTAVDYKKEIIEKETKTPFILDYDSIYIDLKTRLSITKDVKILKEPIFQKTKLNNMDAQITKMDCVFIESNIMGEITVLEFIKDNKCCMLFLSYPKSETEEVNKIINSFYIKW